MGFKNFILSLLILARMSQVSKFERVLSPINVTSNLLEFNFSISGPGPGAEQAGQWLDVQFSWLAQGLSTYGARHELGGGRGLLSNDLWTPSHRWEYSISSNLHLFMFRWFGRIFTRISETEKHLRSCLDWTSSIQASDSVHLDVSWECLVLFSLFQIFVSEMILTGARCPWPLGMAGESMWRSMRAVCVSAWI